VQSHGYGKPTMTKTLLMLNLIQNKKGRLTYFMFTFLFLFFSCKNEQERFSHESTIKIDKVEDKLFEPDKNHVKVSLILHDIDLHPDGIDVLELTNGHILLFYREDQQLFFTNRRDPASLIANSGDGPDEIQSGVRLYSKNGNYYLLQRFRKSRILCDKDSCSLSAIMTFTEMVSYYEELDTNKTLLAGGFIPDKANIRVGSYEEWKSIGAYFIHNDLTIATHLNTSTLIKLHDGNGYLQLFSLLPYVIFLNEKLIINEIFELKSFNPPQINEIKSRRDLFYELDFSSKTSELVWFYHTSDNNILLVVRHFKLVPLSNHPMDTERKVIGYDYYTFNARSGRLEHSGSSNRYIIPVSSGYLSVENYSLYLRE